MTQEQKIFPYIARLLQGAEVVWTTLGDEKKIEIANANRRPVKASERISGNIPYYGANNIQDYVEGYTHEGTYILIAEDGTKSIENYSVQWATGKFWANNHVHVLRGKNNVDSRFIYYYLQTVNFVPFLTGGDRAKLTKAKLLEIQIPLPPLSVQQEIVRILDKFTQLEAELEAELDCRLRQYEYYRNKLLSYEENEVEWKTLGEVGKLKRGTSITKKTSNEGIYPVISGGQQPAYYIDQFNRDGETITVAGSGAYAGFVMYWNEPIFVGDAFSVKADEKQVLPRYIYHFLLSIQEKIHDLKSGGGVPHVYAKDVARFTIPLPPLEEQQRIVTILDKFDTLVNSISEGLPKEIALRRKQYEYYREKLLSFSKE